MDENPILRKLGEEFRELRHPHHDMPAVPIIPTTQESHMTTPQQPQRNVLADVAGILSQMGANQLLARLASERLGELLEPADIDHIIGIVRSLEQPHQQAALNVPAFTPAGQQHDGTQQRDV